ncbi:acyl-CoA thioesterase [Pontibacter arcticus]|uniref:Acyl-CoA thioesterase n=1 Tax=Pontibacter arcticus TaxID=2080288 RepID=A0A364RED0_9BACT|nr:acyl-CoA thioesterase [Pontibacter arcticus]RAU82617.1 acyl-CoA thioesterase [Pontibacter arcticus]
MKTDLSNLPKLLESTARVRFEDCDPFGHLNNSRYIDYFLNAREDQLRENYELDIYAHMKQSGKVWVVSSNQIAYLRELKLMEEVKIQTCLRWYTANEILMEAKMLDIENGSIKAVIWMRFAYIDARKGKRENHEPEIEAIFKAVAIDGEGKQNLYFEDRVKELKATAAAN